MRELKFAASHGRFAKFRLTGFEEAAAHEGPLAASGGAVCLLFVRIFCFAKRFAGHLQDSIEDSQAQDDQGDGHGNRGDEAQVRERRIVQHLIADERRGKLENPRSQRVPETKDCDGQHHDGDEPQRLLIGGRQPNGWMERLPTVDAEQQRAIDTVTNGHNGFENSQAHISLSGRVESLIRWHRNLIFDNQGPLLQ